MAEKWLIDANSILDEFLKRYTEMERDGNLIFSACEIKQDFTDMISNAPTVDAVEVVRCRDCKHWHQHNGKDSGKPVGYGDCKNPCGINGIAYEDSFCSYGERKDGDGKEKGEMRNE